MYLETNRLRVRNFLAGDAASLYEVLSDPEVMRYIEPPYTSEQTRAFLETAGLCDPPLVFAVEWKETGRLIGHAIFHPYDADGYELGWVLSPAFWGRGVASELTKALVARARALGAAYAVIECAPGQDATRHIAEKHGFVLSGRTGGLLLYRKERKKETHDHSTL